MKSQSCSTISYLCLYLTNNLSYPEMKILWLDINSSYSHSSVALPAIHAQVMDRSDWEWCVVRGTINDDPGSLAAQVSEQRPDIIAATFWLFTHQMQIEVLSRAVRLLGSPEVVCGGPEFLGNNEDFLRTHPFITAIIRGEGEVALPRFLETADRHDWSSIEGLCWISDDGAYHDNGIARVSDFASLRYPEESSFFSWDKPFVQLETTRGCFNSCSFCVSAGEKPVRYQTLDQVKCRLENISSHGIKDVRVLDRTFNYDIERASRMLEIFTQYAGKMRFHLEIHPALIPGQLQSRLAELPDGLLHLEAGIQSLDTDVLRLCGRKGSMESSLKGLNYLTSLDNLETHADLIAGLPSYTLEMLVRDIISLISIGVDELQIESLKVLPGTRMRECADKLGIIYSPLPPYEILKTESMSPSDLRYAMKLSRVIDLYYNSQAWQKVFTDLVIENSDFIRNFTAYLDQIMVLNSPLSQERRGDILYEYCSVHHQNILTDISIAWIEAGYSLHKKPAGEIIKVKNLQAEFIEKNIRINILYGTDDNTHRYFFLKSSAGGYLVGYDSQQHKPSPIFMAEVQYM